MLSVEVSSKIRPESLKLRLPASDPYLSFSEPCSPDSGFSSDDSITDSSFSDRISRAKTLPSALRRSRSKQNVKRVRFADSLGLDLENLQYFVNEELCQKFNHISFPQTSTSQSPPQTIQQTPRLIVTNFAYRSEFEYNNLVRASNVCVSALRAAGNSIVGQVNLLNLAFDKSVTVRYTTDNWQTIDEVIAKYSHRMFATEDIDAFNFTIVLPAKLLSGKCEFCVSYQVAGNSYWDNNNGSNYCIDVSIAPPRHFISSPTISTKSISRTSSVTSTLPSIPCTRSNLRKQQRRWGKSLDESDEEIYVPKNFSLKMKM